MADKDYIYLLGDTLNQDNRFGRDDGMQVKYHIPEQTTITIPETYTLTVLKNTELLFGRSYRSPCRLYVKGSITGELATFTALNQQEKWSGIVINGTGEFNDCDILYGGLIVNGNISLNDCTILYSGYGNTPNIDITDGSCLITNCLIGSSSSYGVRIKAKTTILYSKIINNQTGILIEKGPLFIRKSLFDNPININNSSDSIVDARGNYWGLYPVDTQRLIRNQGGILYLPCLLSYETKPRPTPTPLSISGWTKGTSNTSSHLLDIDKGFAVGDEGIILKQNGANWEKISTLSTSTLFSLSFISTNTGWVVGENGSVLKTGDGNSFNKQEIPTKLNLYSVDFVNEKKGCIVGEKGIILTTEDGENYNFSISSVTSDLFKLQLLDETYGFAVGEKGVILKTQNGGKTWSNIGIGTKTYLSLFFISPKEGWVVGEEGTILHTTNGGINWEVQQSPRKNTLFDISFYKGILLCVGNGIILRSLDYGKTWSITSSNLPFSILSISEFFATTENGGIFQYPSIF
jgi:photosystem II stability/assembly factor-like uncharacterized protein